jgi:hypothetical protein
MISHSREWVSVYCYLSNTPAWLHDKPTEHDGQPFAIFIVVVEALMDNASAAGCMLSSPVALHSWIGNRQLQLQNRRSLQLTRPISPRYTCQLVVLLC